MMTRRQVRLGFAPTRRELFSREEAGRYKRLIGEKLRELQVDFVDLEWLNDEGLLYDAAGAVEAAARFHSEGVEALFVPHCNFGTEDAVAKLGKALGKPLLLWGPRDDHPLTDGSRTRDSQCGLFATSKVLRRFGVPFSYITNCRLEDQAFADGLRRFLGAAAAVKSFTHLRIGQIGTRPASFWSVIVNEGELLERFGIEIVPVSLVTIVQAMKDKLHSSAPQVEETAAAFAGMADWTGIDREDMLKMAALKLAMAEWAGNEGCTAVALQCWNALQKATGIMPCFVNGVLTDAGLPIACETDIHGAITSVILSAAASWQSPTFFADLTIRHPENDHAELLWHCGPFPRSLKAESAEAKVGEHYVLPSACPGVAEWQIKGGDVTIARFDGDHGEYKLLFGEGRGVTGPKNRGTYMYIQVDDWPRWEEKFIYGPYIHHVAGVHGKAAGALEEACRYLPSLQPDRL